MSSVLKNLAPTSGRGGRSPHQSLNLGPAKANVGHAESAPGVMALIKTLLMLQNNTIPPHCGIKTKINHNFPTDLAERNVHISRAAAPWNPKLWKSFGIEPNFVFGHSLEQYAALNVAGVLSASDTIYLMGTKAQLLLDKCEAGCHTMLAVRVSVLQIRQFLNANIHEVACINGPREVVISGKVADINQLAEHLAADNIKATRVQVPFAFHSAQVDLILPDLDVAASRVTVHSPQVPVLCALEASIIHPGDHGSIGPLHMQRHCRKTVNFEGALKTAERESLISTSGDTLWIEIGPHTACSAF
ncbi:hypothetical protein SGCOL_005551 [Colletotrichum sp. CLE4]